ncbi:MAG: hypothetical protein ACPGC5_06445 [Flavobacteriaceae bacterium]
MMLGLHDVQYLYEFLFWVITFLGLKRVWHQPQVRLWYGYGVASLNMMAVFFFTSLSINGHMDGLTAVSFGFLHAMVAVVMITLVRNSLKLENKEEGLEE